MAVHGCNPLEFLVKKMLRRFNDVFQRSKHTARAECHNNADYTHDIFVQSELCIHFYPFRMLLM